MKINEIIDLLQKTKEQHGNIECVIEIEDLFNKKINSTVERIDIVAFNGLKAVKFDWRTY